MPDINLRCQCMNSIIIKKCDILHHLVQLHHKQLELQSLLEYFYEISEVPSKGVKLDNLDNRRIFIQSTSQGSRCLKKGAKLLYLKT